MAGDAIQIGDQICLYCEDTKGYVFSNGSSHSTIYTHWDQLRKTPVGVSNPHTLVFELQVPNNYQAEAAYRLWKERVEGSADQTHGATLQEATETEKEVNEEEQRKSLKKKLRYGQKVQLRHRFTNKFLTVNSKQSIRETTSLLAGLTGSNGKDVQFVVQSWHKSKADGDVVQHGDRIVLESVRCSGQSLHASEPFADADGRSISEINISLKRTAFFVTLFEKIGQEAPPNAIKGGSFIKLFYETPSSYLTAERVDEIKGNVYLRARQDLKWKPKSQLPSTSAITYWQIERAENFVFGGVIQWNDKIRLRHVATDRFLCVGSDGGVSLNPEGTDLGCVLQLHSPHDEKHTKNECMAFECVASIVHKAKWIASSTEFKRKPDGGSGDKDTLERLRWDKAERRKLKTATQKSAGATFIVQQVEPCAIQQANFVTSVLNNVQELYYECKQEEAEPSREFLQEKCRILEEVKEFMTINGVAQKDRQKLLRNLRLVELLFRFLRIKPHNVDENEALAKVYHSVYGVLEVYLQGISAKNQLFCVKHFPLLCDHCYLWAKHDYACGTCNLLDELGRGVAAVITELVRDNKLIIDRFSRKELDRIIKFVKKHKKHYLLDLIGALCVCDGVYLPVNQNYICEKWLEPDSHGILATYAGDIIKVRDPEKSWMSMTEFCQSAGDHKVRFLVSQLLLFAKLCAGGNSHVLAHITVTHKYMTAAEAFHCITDDGLPDLLRAAYANVIIHLFIDVKNNTYALDESSVSFVLADLGRGSNTMRNLIQKSSRQLKKEAEVLQEWIQNFLHANERMVGNNTDRNYFLEQVLDLTLCLIKYGYYDQSKDVEQLMSPLIRVLDGENDLPGRGSNVDKATYRLQARFEPSAETEFVVNTKYKALELLEFMHKIQSNSRIENFALFFKKHQEENWVNFMSQPLQNPEDSPALRDKVLPALTKLISDVQLFDMVDMTQVIMDSSRYKYDRIVQKAVDLMFRLHLERTELLSRAAKVQLLSTEASVLTRNEVERRVLSVRQFSHIQLEERTAPFITEAMNYFTNLCHLPESRGERHPINQTILLNHGVLELLFKLLFQNTDPKVMEEVPDVKEAMLATVKLLTALAKENATVQTFIFNNMDSLLTIEELVGPIAGALFEAFDGDQRNDMKIHYEQVENIVALAAKYKETAPELLELLDAIVLLEELGVPLRRNQEYVMRAVIQHFSDLLYFRDRPPDKMQKMLKKQGDADHLAYLLHFVNLLASCADGCDAETQYILLACADVFTVEELVTILSDREIPYYVKTYFLRFLHHVYVNTTKNSEQLCTKILPLLAGLSRRLHAIVDYTGRHREQITQILQFPPCRIEYEEKLYKPFPSVPPFRTDSDRYGNFHFLFEAAFPFLEAFFQQNYDFREPATMRVVDDLVGELVAFYDTMKPLITKNKQLQTLSRCLVASILQASSVPVPDIEPLLHDCDSEDLNEEQSEAQQKYDEYHKEETELNERLGHYVECLKAVYSGTNTCEEQLGHGGSKHYSSECLDNRSLPLGQEFQTLFARFIVYQPEPGPSKGARTSRLIAQLEASASTLVMKNKDRSGQIALDTKCLQLLRALLHNQERKLPTNWMKDPDFRSSTLEIIGDFQDQLNAVRTLQRTFELISRREGGIGDEFIAFLNMMLFNESMSSQEAIADYVLNNTEEKFLPALFERLRFAQSRQKHKALIASQVAAAKKADQESLFTLKTRLRDRHPLTVSDIHLESTCDKHNQRKPQLETVPPKTMSEVTLDEGYTHYIMTTWLQDIEEVHLEPILRCLHGCCSGQNTVLQDYLREQPHRARQINILGELMAYLRCHFSTLNHSDIPMCSQVLNVLTEIVRGNADNLQVLLENDIVLYINHLLSSRQYQHSSGQKQELKLLESIGNLIVVITEESNASDETVQTILSGLDEPSITTVIHDCYKMYLRGNQNFSNNQNVNNNSNNNSNSSGQTIQNGFMRAASLFYSVRHRQTDTAALEDMPSPDSKHAEALEHFAENSMTVEIVKNDTLRKVWFRADNPSILCNETKREIKLNSDRTSSSTKHRDLVYWADEIAADHDYHQNLHGFCFFLLVHWTVWNYACILLSLVLCILMLVFFKPQASIHAETVYWQAIPPSVHDPVPILGDWKWGIIGVGVLHNIFALLVCVTAHIGRRRRPPPHLNHCKWCWCFKQLLCSLYFAIFLGLSIAATVFYGYFFACHLLHIVYCNRSLRRTFRAITLNGRTLVWLVVLLVVFIFLCALLGFAVFRSTMDHADHVHCHTLAQCFFTFIRFSVIGDLYEKTLPHSLEQYSYGRFAAVAVFHLLVWVCVTVFGFFLIFAVIIDTFSCIRAQEFQAEEDMRKRCFICNRTSEEFEAHGLGFQHHITREHCMWSYLLFLVHLRSTQTYDLVPSERYILNQLDEGDYSFFPTGRAASLSEWDDEGARRLEELSGRVDALTDKVEGGVNNTELDSHNTLKLTRKQTSSFSQLTKDHQPLTPQSPSRGDRVVTSMPTLRKSEGSDGGLKEAPSNTEPHATSSGND